MSSGLGRLLDPRGVERRQARPSTRSRRRRPSAGWRRSRSAIVGADRLAGDPQRRTSSSRSAPTLSLIWVKPSATASRQSRAQLLVGVAEPAGRRRVRRIAPLEQRAVALGAPASRAPAGCSSASLGRQRVGEVAEVDQHDDLLGRHVGEQLPQRLARRAWPAGPRAALTTAPIAMCMTPFSGPSQRSWVSPISAREKPPEVGQRRRPSRPTTYGASASIAATCDLVAAADGEGEAVALVPVAPRRCAGPRRRRSSRGRGSSRPSRRARATSGSGRPPRRGLRCVATDPHYAYWL